MLGQLSSPASPSHLPHTQATSKFSQPDSQLHHMQSASSWNRRLLSSNKGDISPLPSTDPSKWKVLPHSLLEQSLSYFHGTSLIFWATCNVLLVHFTLTRDILDACLFLIRWMIMQTILLPPWPLLYLLWKPDKPCQRVSVTDSSSISVAEVSVEVSPAHLDCRKSLHQAVLKMYLSSSTQGDHSVLPQGAYRAAHCAGLTSASVSFKQIQKVRVWLERPYAQASIHPLSSLHLKPTVPQQDGEYTILSTEIFSKSFFSYSI